jgi:hypothetical protein
VSGAAEFFDKQTREKFVPRGVNYFYLVPVGRIFQDRGLAIGVYDRARVATDFATLHEHGFNTVRIFFDSCSGDDSCLTRPGVAGVNPRYLDNMIEVMQLAKENGIYILFTSNDIPDDGGYGELANQGSNEFFAGYRNAHFLTAQGVQAMTNYWRDLMRALVARGAPFDAVLGWSLLNEQWFFEKEPPLSLTSGQVTTANGKTYDLAVPGQKRQMLSESVVFLIQQARNAILQEDPTALVTMGFFVPRFPIPLNVAPEWYVDTASLLPAAPLDFFDFHAYPGGAPVAELAHNFGMVGVGGKPIVMGEVGAFIAHYSSAQAAALAVQTWIAESCAVGYDGWLYWGFYRAPEALGDATWGFVDADRTMMKALAPVNQPDPCVTTLVNPNLAAGKPVSASQSLPDTPPSLAVDDKPSTWISGGHPPQWIEIDLQAAAPIRAIRLTVAQDPSGTTVHRVLGKGASGDFVLLHQFSGATQEGQLLEFAPPAPWQGIRFIRIETTVSPSWVAWREIQVLGGE